MSREYFDLGIEPVVQGNHNEEVAESNEKEKFGKLMKENLENKAVFKIEFSSANEDGDLMVRHEGWTIIMKNAESINLGDGKKTYNARRRFYKVENEYHVVVTEIDESASTIYVSHAQATRILRHALSKKIRDELLAQQKDPSKRKQIILPARIASINDEEGFLRLDIAGFNIMGIANSKNLSYNRKECEKLSDAYRVGDELDVQIYSIGNLKNGMHIFVCGTTFSGRKNVWTGIGERFKEKDMVVVQCKRFIPSGAFIGSIDGEDISVLCIYPKFVRTRQEHLIQPGRSYKCVVIKVDEKAHKFKCKVLAPLDEEKVNKRTGLTESVEQAFIAELENTVVIDEAGLQNSVAEKVMSEEEILM